MSTQPADRQAAERALTKVYASIARPRPRFEWVASPRQALALIAGWPTLGQLFARIRDPHPQGKPPLASDLAVSVSRMRSALSAGVAHPDPELSRVGRAKRNEPWPELPPMAALEAGVPLGVVLHQSVRIALDRSLAQGFRLGDWTALSRSCGWWWPGEEVCVVVDRPELVRIEPLPRTWHDEVRLRPDGIGYRDGWRPLLA